MKAVKAAFLGLFFLFATGCVLAPPQPQTPTEAVAISYATVAGLATAVQQNYLQGRLTREQAERLANELDESLVLLREAEFLIGLDRPQDAATVLSTVSAILLRIEDALR